MATAEVSIVQPCHCQAAYCLLFYLKIRLSKGNLSVLIIFIRLKSE
jgi:hypothetical protein